MGNPVTGLNAITPALNAKSVTPSNTVNLTSTAKALRVGAAGAISVEMVGDGDTAHTLVIAAALAGEILPLQVTRVNATGTTATNITALY